MAEKLCQVVGGEGLENENTAPGQKSRVDLKGRVFRGGPDEDDAPLFHIREKCVLLGLIEAVDLVHKHQGPEAGAAAQLGPCHDLLDFLDPAGDGAEIHEVGVGPSGDDAGQSGLSDAGRTPEDHRRDLVLVDELAQKLAFSQQVLLAHKGFQRLRPQPAGQRRHGLFVIEHG